MNDLNLSLHSLKEVGRDNSNDQEGGVDSGKSKEKKY